MQWWVRTEVHSSKHWGRNFFSSERERDDMMVPSSAIRAESDGRHIYPVLLQFTVSASGLPVEYTTHIYNIAPYRLCAWFYRQHPLICLNIYELLYTLYMFNDVVYINTAWRSYAIRLAIRRRHPCFRFPNLIGITTTRISIDIAHNNNIRGIDLSLPYSPYHIDMSFVYIYIYMFVGKGHE